jgi:cell wall-associated NlpC family hydrolase
MIGDQMAQAAEALIGAPFRLHGRDPATGLDCIGVIAISLSACGRPVHLPAGYALRTRALPQLEAFVTGSELEAACGPPMPGDVLLLRVGPCQFHLALTSSENRFIHALAGLRRVVHSELPASWVIVGHWRPIFAD